MSIEQLKKKLESEREKEAIDNCVFPFSSHESDDYRKDYYKQGHEFATNRLLPLLQKAVEMAEFYARECPQACYTELLKENNMSAFWVAEPDLDASVIFKRVYPAREFLSEFTKMTEIKKESV